MKSMAICSPTGAWAIIGKHNGKKAVLTLKHSEKGSIVLSEKDLRPIYIILGAAETTMSDERRRKEAQRAMNGKERRHP
jgi:hypothetical protein